MPKNYFEDRPEMTKYPMLIQRGDLVEIITKDKQGAKSRDALIKGYVYKVLSKGKYYRNGVKVKLIPEANYNEDMLGIDISDEELIVGRIQYM